MASQNFPFICLEDEVTTPLSDADNAHAISNTKRHEPRGVRSLSHFLHLLRRLPTFLKSWRARNDEERMLCKKENKTQRTAKGKLKNITIIIIINYIFTG